MAKSLVSDTNVCFANSVASVFQFLLFFFVCVCFCGKLKNICINLICFRSFSSQMHEIYSKT